MINPEESALDRASSLLKAYSSGGGKSGGTNGADSFRASAPAALNRQKMSNTQSVSSSRYDEDDISFDGSDQSNESSFDDVGNLETSSTFKPGVTFMRTSARSSETDSSRARSTPSPSGSGNSSSQQANLHTTVMREPRPNIAVSQVSAQKTSGSQIIPVSKTSNVKMFNAQDLEESVASFAESSINESIRMNESQYSAAIEDDASYSNDDFEVVDDNSYIVDGIEQEQASVNNLRTASTPLQEVLLSLCALIIKFCFNFLHFIG